jgi:hypothetical protein
MKYGEQRDDRRHQAPDLPRGTSCIGLMSYGMPCRFEIGSNTSNRILL